MALIVALGVPPSELRLLQGQPEPPVPLQDVGGDAKAIRFVDGAAASVAAQLLERRGFRTLVAECWSTIRVCAPSGGLDAVHRQVPAEDAPFVFLRSDGADVIAGAHGKELVQRLWDNLAAAKWKLAFTDGVLFSEVVGMSSLGSSSGSPLDPAARATQDELLLSHLTQRLLALQQRAPPTYNREGLLRVKHLLCASKATSGGASQPLPRMLRMDNVTTEDSRTLRRQRSAVESRPSANDGGSRLERLRSTGSIDTPDDPWASERPATVAGTLSNRDWLSAGLSSGLRVDAAEFVPATPGKNVDAPPFIPPGTPARPHVKPDDPMKVVTLANLVDDTSESARKEVVEEVASTPSHVGQSRGPPRRSPTPLSLADSIVAEPQPSPAASAWASQSAALSTPNAAQQAMAAQAMVQAMGAMQAMAAQGLAASPTPMARSPPQASGTGTPAAAEQQRLLTTPTPGGGPKIVSRSRLHEMLYELVEKCCERQGGRWEKDYDLIDLSSDSDGGDGDGCDDDDDDVDAPKGEDNAENPEGDDERRDRRRKKQERRRRKKERERQWKERVEAGATAVEELDDDKRERRQARRNRKIGILVSSIKTEWSRYFGPQCPLTFYMSFFGLKKLKLLLLEVQHLMLIGIGGYMRVTTVSHALKYCDPFPPSAIMDKEKAEDADGDATTIAPASTTPQDTQATVSSQPEEEVSPENRAANNNSNSAQPEVILTGSRSPSAHKFKYHLHRLLYSLIASRCQQQQMAALEERAKEGNPEAAMLLDQLSGVTVEIPELPESDSIPECAPGASEIPPPPSTVLGRGDDTDACTGDPSPTTAAAGDETQASAPALTQRKPPEPICTAFGEQGGVTTNAPRPEESSSAKQAKIAVAELLASLPMPQGVFVSEIKTEWKREYTTELQPLMEKVGCKKVSRLIHTVPGLRIVSKDADMRVVVVPKKITNGIDGRTIKVTTPSEEACATPMDRPGPRSGGSRRIRTLALAEDQALEPGASPAAGRTGKDRNAISIQPEHGDIPMTPYGAYPAASPQAAWMNAARCGPQSPWATPHGGEWSPFAAMTPGSMNNNWFNTMQWGASMGSFVPPQADTTPRPHNMPRQRLHMQH